MGYGSPLSSSTQYETLGAGTGVGTTVTASGTVNVKGSYATLGTASFGYDGFFLDALVLAGGTAGRGRIDIAVNTGGSDQIIVADLGFCSTGGVLNGSVAGLFLPIKIPAGAVVKMRWQSATASATLTALVTGFAGDARQVKGFRGAISLTDFTNSDPTNSCTLNGTTQTGWTQICASSAGRVAGLFASFTDLGTALTSTRLCLIDIGWGTAGSERVLRRSLVWAAPATTMHQYIKTIPCDFPAGTRFAFRAQCNNTDANVIGMVLGGLVP